MNQLYMEQTAFESGNLGIQDVGYICMCKFHVTGFTITSVCNRSGIIAQHSVSNAKPLVVDLKFCGYQRQTFSLTMLTVQL